MGNGLTQKTRKTQKNLHVFTRIYTEKISRKGAKGAERYVLLFLCQKSCTQNSQKYTEFAPHASAKVCAVCVKQFHSAWH